jgi:acetyl esterase/lipase
MVDGVCGPPPEFAARIRARGNVLDMQLIKDLYAPLLATQSTSGVRIASDLAYGTDVRQRLDIYRPDSAPKPATAAAEMLPIIVSLHGGGFIRGDKRERANVGLRLAREGFVVVVPSYRLGPTHQWPAGAEDVKLVLEWLALRAAAYGGDVRRVFVSGESAGAAHVAAATLLRRFHPSGGLRIAGAVLISGVYNTQLEYLARRQFNVATPDPRNEAYFGNDFSRYPAMSTVELIDAMPFPLLITYAELDMPQMQVQAGELFARLVTRHGFQPELAVIAGHNHLTQIYSVNTGDESLITPVLAFVRAELKRVVR